MGGVLSRCTTTRGAKDLFGRAFNFEQANLADALAASAVLAMGEGSEQTPLAILRNVPDAVWHSRKTNKGWHSFKVPMQEDLFAPFLTKAKWKKGEKANFGSPFHPCG